MTSGVEGEATSSVAKGEIQCWSIFCARLHCFCWPSVTHAVCCSFQIQIRIRIADLGGQPCAAGRPGIGAVAYHGAGVGNRADVHSGGLLVGHGGVEVWGVRRVPSLELGLWPVMALVLEIVQTFILAGFWWVEQRVLKCGAVVGCLPWGWGCGLS